MIARVGLMALLGLDVIALLEVARARRRGDPMDV
jgi:hypothetical protein